jgi:hypothetical protein
VTKSLTVSILVLALLGCQEAYESHYPDRAAAVADGAIARGWLPEWLPQTATDIHEWHDLDTNSSKASFRYEAGDAPKLPLGCQASSVVPEEAAEARASGQSFESYACPDQATARGVLLVAVDETARRVYLQR